MLHHHDARLEGLTEEEKVILKKEINQRILVKAIVLLIPFAILFATLLYINFNQAELALSETFMSWANVILVILAFFPGRLFVGYLIEYMKELKGWHKKVVIGKIHKLRKTGFYIGKHKVHANPAMLGGFHEGDSVEAHMSTKVGILIRLIKK